ncbi:hypothetical protein PJ985_06145, partial [Streptomyces sp. ACA25]|nr:hypothetical protein [Streptomyces sp. ACA25]
TGSPPQPFPHHGHGAWPQRDADATEVIPPVVDGPPGPYGTRETSLEATAAMPVVPGFDNLYDRQPAPVAGPPGQGRPSGGRAAARRAAAQRQRRRPSPVVIGVLVVTACAVVGLAAGAALSGGDGAAAEETEEGTTEEIEGRSLDGAGPGNGETGAGTDENDGEAAVREQAEQLSELLADSSGSRETVIRAVGDVQECRNLDQAIEDLREAAGQREGLVTRLNALDVGALPGHAELAEALTEAWEASAEADEHFAVWGEEARDRKKVCRRGTARATDSTGRAYLASGEATAAKERAAALWNPVAREHGLPERQPVEL